MFRGSDKETGRWLVTFWTCLFHGNFESYKRQCREGSWLSEGFCPGQFDKILEGIVEITIGEYRLRRKSMRDFGYFRYVMAAYRSIYLQKRSRTCCQK